MKVCGFTYTRNGIKFDYPFRESIRSLLPLCDELVVVVGDSDDGTRAAVAALDPQKIRIVDSVWDDRLRSGGKIFAQQTNIGLDHISGDWAIHLQSDEILHEKDYPKIRAALERELQNSAVEGFIFPYHHFWGYDHICPYRRSHRHEVRVIRPNRLIRSYKDSQGFRKYPSPADYQSGHPGEKLRVKKIDAYVHHYSRVRNPEKELEKVKYFHRFWHDDAWIEKEMSGQERFNYEMIDKVEPFTGTHPQVMLQRIAAANWSFKFDPSKSKTSFKNQVLYWVEKTTGWRIGEYKNYKLLK